MGWWPSEHGVMGDEPAELVQQALRELRATRPDLTLEALRDGIEQALRAAPADTFADPWRLDGTLLSAGSRAETPSVPAADPRLLGALIAKLATVWKRPDDFPPCLGEVLDAFSFVLRPDAGQYLPGQSDAQLSKLELVSTRPPQTLDALLQNIRECGYGCTFDLCLQKADVERLLAEPNLDELVVEVGTIAADAWPMLGEARSLRILRLGSPDPSEPPWTWLARLTELSVLDLADSFTDDRIVPSLRELRSLRTLIVARTPLTDAALADLELPLLEEFEAHMTALGDRTALALARSSPLTSAGFGRTPIGDAGLAALARIPTLEKLEAAGVSAAALELLAICPALAELAIDAPTPASTLGTLAKAPTLTRLTLSSATPAHLRAIAAPTCLRTLALQGVDFADEHAAALTALRTISTLDLRGSYPQGSSLERLRTARPDLTIVLDED